MKPGVVMHASWPSVTDYVERKYGRLYTTGSRLRGVVRFVVSDGIAR